MATPEDLNFPGDRSRGDGAARVRLSELINAVLDVDVLEDRAGNLAAARPPAPRANPPKEFEVEESKLPRRAEGARHVSARQETCAGA